MPSRNHDFTTNTICDKILRKTCSCGLFEVTATNDPCVIFTLHQLSKQQKHNQFQKFGKTDGKYLVKCQMFVICLSFPQIFSLKSANSGTKNNCRQKQDTCKRQDP